MDPVFRWIEASRLSNWIGQSDSIFAFPGILVLHTLGMGLLLGVSVATALCLLGAAPHVALAELLRFRPLRRIGLWLSIVSGVLLLVAYPTKALTNPYFYAKLAGLSVALAANARIDSMPPVSQRRRLAVVSLFAWAAVMLLGRLLEYTYTRLYVDFADVA